MSDFDIYDFFYESRESDEDFGGWDNVNHVHPNRQMHVMMRVHDWNGGRDPINYADHDRISLGLDYRTVTEDQAKELIACRVFFQDDSFWMYV